MAQSLTLPAEQVVRTRRRIDARRVMHDYSFTFGLILAVGLLIANIATESGGFGLTNDS